MKRNPSSVSTLGAESYKRRGRGCREQTASLRLPLLPFLPLLKLLRRLVLLPLPQHSAFLLPFLFAGLWAPTAGPVSALLQVLVALLLLLFPSQHLSRRRILELLLLPPLLFRCLAAAASAWCYCRSFLLFEQVVDFIENIEIKKFVLVHGEGFGAWCWYKCISLLEEAGLHPVALDLTGSGIDHTDTNSITTMAEYARPLLDFLQNLSEDEKVILVGHSCGGASISYAMECYPKKISKAVFLTATMVSNGQRPFDVFAEELASADVFMQQSQLLTYGNGRDRSPTALAFEKHHIKGLYFHNSPPKDVALATVSIRPIPLRPFMEKLSLTPEKYGTVRRYFIQTLEDLMLSPDVQEKLVRENPPHGVYKIKGSDHCPFFSKSQALHKILLEIARLP